MYIYINIYIYMQVQEDSREEMLKPIQAQQY